MNVRLPAWRVPGWLLVFWWLARGLFRLTVLAVRYWWLTAPDRARAVGPGRVRWPGPGRRRHDGCRRLRRRGGGGIRSSWLRFGWYPLVARVRALVVYRPRWASVMATCGLATVFGGDRYVPRLVQGAL